MRSGFGLIVGLQSRFGNERLPEVPNLFVHGAVGAVQHAAAKLDPAARTRFELENATEKRSLHRFLMSIDRVRHNN